MSYDLKHKVTKLRDSYVMRRAKGHSYVEIDVAIKRLNDMLHAQELHDRAGLMVLQPVGQIKLTPDC